MKVRRRLIQFNGRPREPIEQISGRAKRYRANADDIRPDDPRMCGFCFAQNDVIPHHITGDETDTEKQLLMWACRSCNQRVAHIMRKAGIGRLCVQYNPKKRGGSSSDRARYQSYITAVKILRGSMEGDTAWAANFVAETPHAVRSRYTRRAWDVRKKIYGPSGRQGKFSFDDEVPF